ncbi:PTS transporter subunit EIIC [Dellaglioa sp. BT-FLS60]
MMAIWQGFSRKLLSFDRRIKKSFIYQAIEKTFAIILPFIIIGSLSLALSSSVFSKQGFFNQVYDISSWLPYETVIKEIFEIINTVTMGFIAIMTAFLSAKYMTRFLGKDEQIAGFTGAIGMLVLNYNLASFTSDATQETFFSQELGIRGVFISLILGVFVGYIFKWFSPRNRQGKGDYSPFISRGIVSLIPVVIILGILIGLTMLASIANQMGVNGLLYSLFRLTEIKSKHLIVTLLFLAFFNNILFGVGISGPLGIMQGGLDDTSVVSNLSYALKHGTSFGAPFPISIHTIYDSFGSFGGTGMTLSLIIAILITSKDKNSREIAKFSIIPSFVNINFPLMFGLPVILNPILMIPFIIAPLVSMLIGYFFIYFKWMPPAVYNLPKTTPAPLMAFLGTNGHWSALVVSGIVLVVTVLIYIPFVKLNNQAARDDGGKLNEK